MKHFKAKEFACGCGMCGKGFAEMDGDLLQRLDIARGLAGVPFVITSAIRCRAHNYSVGGLKDSAHLGGNAVDIKCDKARDRYKVLYSLISAGFNRIGIYNNFIHVDNDTTKPARVIWYGA